MNVLHAKQQVQRLYLQSLYHLGQLEQGYVYTLLFISLCDMALWSTLFPLSICLALARHID
ncbi:hypothetical protein VAE308_1051558 [Vibrio aestuarianus]|nr:hypothetical protein VAE308_1051558 [Vibrio aestuarianus]CAH8212220.1 hypothetical protein VAE032_271553 [Vibrio aestuarianus]CAH8212371.1 hypothetical protein VAE128_461556 [Vibrio aestuarianus]